MQLICFPRRHRSHHRGGDYDESHVAATFLCRSSGLSWNKSHYCGKRNPNECVHSPFALMNSEHRRLMSRLAYKSGRVLLEASPVYLDLAKIKEDLLSVSSFHLMSHCMPCL
jgi:hypothetical protein